jgi:hypothetical protein
MRRKVIKVIIVKHKSKAGGTRIAWSIQPSTILAHRSFKLVLIQMSRHSPQDHHTSLAICDGAARG